ncbi:MAG: tRNA pseudouridine(55) synthase TruB [Ruminococcaceae bacterium]|nr:tRNA pseudouridine(55) synthase TruB [Oscillospiraceae bacterium]
MTEIIQEPCGILLIDKPAGMTSHDVVFRTRRLFSTKRVGHTGTLDPMATGVLVVLIGRAAKASEYVSHDEKSYDALLRLGITSDTEDVSGIIDPSSVIPVHKLPSAEEVLDIAPRFRGAISQIPPMYSALKVGGRKLCDIARKGGVIEREARDIVISRLDIRPHRLPSDYCLSVTCSGGTYIRTLCADIGHALGCGGVMASLRRTAAGGFSLAQCYTLSALEEMTYENRLSVLLPTEALFDDLPAVILQPFYHSLCRNGCELYQSRIGTHFEIGCRVRLCAPDGNFFALGEVKEYENGTAIKAIKLFSLS